MAITKFEKDMQIIAQLDDQPNDVGGLTAAELKDKFDEGGKAIKEYLNDTLIPELESPAAAASTGATDKDGSPSTVQAELDKVSNLGGATSTAEQLDQAVNDSHTHSNKALLDSYTQTEENLLSAVELKHTHANKSALDGIAAVTQTLGNATDRVPSEAAVARALTASGNLPSGGTKGQALVKQSEQPFDANWADILPQSGNAGEFLAKDPDSPTGSKWVDPNEKFYTKEQANREINKRRDSTFQKLLTGRIV